MPVLAGFTDEVLIGEGHKISAHLKNRGLAKKGTGYVLGSLSPLRSGGGRAWPALVLVLVLRASGWLGERWRGWRAGWLGS